MLWSFASFLIPISEAYWGKPALIQAEGGAVRVDPGALPLTEEQVIFIQKVRERDAEQVRQLVHSLFFIVVHGVLF
jgi:hypothetical protein